MEHIECLPGPEQAAVRDGLTGGKKVLILSANAVPNSGGQGLNLHHMIEGLAKAFEIRLFCRAEHRAVKTKTVPDSRLSNLISRLPVLRRLRDVQNLASDRQFDRYVARHLERADLFQGVGGQCLDSLRTARSLGCRTVVDCVTTHIEDFENQQKTE